MKLIRKIKIYHLTGNIKNPKVKKIVEFFNICNNLEEYYSDEYPKSIFYKYNDKIYFELDSENNVTRCIYTDFWKKMHEFGFNNMEIKELTRYMLKVYLKKPVPQTIPMWSTTMVWVNINLKSVKDCEAN